jgi:hypothetical protein
MHSASSFGLNGSDQSNHLVQGAFVWLLARRAGVDQLIDQAVEEINIHSTEGRRGQLAKRVASLERAPASPDDAWNRRVCVDRGRFALNLSSNLIMGPAVV